MCVLKRCCDEGNPGTGGLSKRYACAGPHLWYFHVGQGQLARRTTRRYSGRAPPAPASAFARARQPRDIDTHPAAPAVGSNRWPTAHRRRFCLVCCLLLGAPDCRRPRRGVQEQIQGTKLVKLRLRAGRIRQQAIYLRQQLVSGIRTAASGARAAARFVLRGRNQRMRSRATHARFWREEKRWCMPACSTDLLQEEPLAYRKRPSKKLGPAGSTT